MKRREQTRIELKLDDIQEYEAMKRKNESTSTLKMKHENGINALLEAAEVTEKNRAEVIRSRIGFDPTPRMTTPPPHNLQ